VQGPAPCCRATHVLMIGIAGFLSLSGFRENWAVCAPCFARKMSPEKLSGALLWRWVADRRLSLISIQGGRAISFYFFRIFLVMIPPTLFDLRARGARGCWLARCSIVWRALLLLAVGNLFHPGRLTQVGARYPPAYRGSFVTTASPGFGRKYSAAKAEKKRKKKSAITGITRGRICQDEGLLYFFLFERDEFSF